MPAPLHSAAGRNATFLPGPSRVPSIAHQSSESSARLHH
jgi:hypothetical protein